MRRRAVGPFLRDGWSQNCTPLSVRTVRISIWSGLDEHVVQVLQKAVTQLPGILGVHHIAGAFDYSLRVAGADLASYESFHADRLTALPGWRTSLRMS
jgi:DNA-binding Lrp family transcriptional regulator